MVLLMIFVQAGCPYSEAVKEVGFPGPGRSKAYTTHHNPTTEVTVYCPDGAASSAPCPLIIFNGGWNLDCSGYDTYGRNLAQWGYVCVMRKTRSAGIGGIGLNSMTPNFDDVYALIDWVDRESRNKMSPLYGRVDATNVGVAGHSLGGVVALVTGATDPYIKAVVTLDTLIERKSETERLQLLGASTPPALFVASEDGGFCTYPPFVESEMENLHDIVPGPTALITITDADHIDFDQLQQGYLACPHGRADPKHVRAVASRYMIAWFNMYLKGQFHSNTPHFAGHLADSAVASGDVAISVKGL